MMTYRIYNNIHNARKNIYVLMALIGLWFFYLWNAFSTGRSFALFMDNEFFLGPVLSWMSATLSHGEWPLRMDTILGGIPLYNCAQLSPFYPFYFASLPIYNGPLDVIHAMHWVVLGHILITEINMYVFLRVISASRLASFTGAALVAFSANSFSYANWINIVAPYSWFPLYLAGLIGILKCPKSMRYSAMALSGIVLLTLASPAQPLIHAIFISIVLIFAYWRQQLRLNGNSEIRYALSRLVAVGILALFLVAPALLPTVLEFKNMIRWIGAFPPVMGNARIPFAAFQIDQLSIADLGGVLFKIQGGAVGNQFTGVLTLALAGIALASRPRSWIVVAFAFIATYSLISSTGSNLGLAYLNYIIPILNKIREPSRFLVLFQFAIGVLAAQGIDELRKTVSGCGDRDNAKRQLIISSITSAVAVISLFVLRNRTVSNVSPWISIALLFVLTLTTSIAARSALPRRGTLIAIAWGGLALILLSIEVPWAPPTISSSQYLTTGALALDAAINRVTMLDPDHQYRVLFDGKIDKQRAAMLASYRGVRTFNMYFNPASRHHFEELYYHGPRPDNYFRVLGAKYLICKDCTAESLHDYNFIDRIAGYDIYETNNVLARTYISHRINGEFSDLSDFVSKVAPINLENNVLYIQPGKHVELNETNGTDNEECISREDFRTTNHYRIVVQCKSAGVLVINEFFDDAWMYKVDGIRTQSLKVNGNQMGVFFPAGSHIIECRYLPTIFLVSLGISFAGVSFIIYVLALRVKARKNSRS